MRDLNIEQSGKEGVEAAFGGEIYLERASIVRAWVSGLTVGGVPAPRPSKAVVSDLLIKNTLTPALSFGGGVTVRAGSVAITRFSITDNSLLGADVDLGADLDLYDGEFSNNGKSVSLPAMYDALRLFDHVTYAASSTHFARK